MARSDRAATGKSPWWRSIGPALITACVVFGPGSLLISSKVGASHGYELLWLLVLTGVLMGTYMTTVARIGVVGGATPCTLIATRLGRVAAAVIGINLCLICTAFQFSNNLAVAAAFDTLGVARLFGDPNQMTTQTRNTINAAARFQPAGHRRGLRPAAGVSRPGTRHEDHGRGDSRLLPREPPRRASQHRPGPRGPDPAFARGAVAASADLVASLLGTTFSVAGAFYQGNLVREKGWKIGDYRRGIGDSIAGVAVLTGVSAIIMITAGTVLVGRPANDIGALAQQLRPLLGPATHTLFCVGLVAVAMNPFVINAMIGGSILADGLGKPARLSDRWSRWFTVLVLLVGMGVAMIVLHTPVKKVDAIVFGQALTVTGNPLMAAAILWLANRKDIMGEKRNTLFLNILGGLGFVVVLLMALRVLYILALRLT